jgi:hypothetical protein
MHDWKVLRARHDHRWWHNVENVPQREQGGV